MAFQCKETENENLKFNTNTINMYKIYKYRPKQQHKKKAGTKPTPLKNIKYFVSYKEISTCAHIQSIINSKFVCVYYNYLFASVRVPNIIHAVNVQYFTY